jgi:C-terminal processing protease CtpA/Prc
MTSDQKVADFTQLAATFAKNYGPIQWKRDSIGFDLLSITPWLSRAAATKDDLAFYDLCTEYVASLQDAHSGFYLPSDFYASLPFKVDIYDGRVLVDGLSGSLEGIQYPIGMNDEILALDGKAVSDEIDELSKYAMLSNPSATRRLAAAYLVSRPQQLIPRANELPDETDVTVRHPDGSIETVTVNWEKTGTPLSVLGPVISPHAKPLDRGPGASPSAEAGFPDYLAPLMELRNMRIPAAKFVRGFGQTAPVFYFPSDFQLRTGNHRGDPIYSGTYTRDGVRIGYIRIPSFSLTLATPILEKEIAFMEENTDGLVLDIMRNPGGDACFAQAVLQRIIPYRFRMIGLEIRATRPWLTSFENALVAAQNSGASDQVISQYRSIVAAVNDAYLTPSGRTPPLPVCGPSLDVDPALDSTGESIAYTKPILLLTDEFSASAADLFAAAFQDAHRGVIFGTRTTGAGGNVESFANVTTYSDASATITESLMVRAAPVDSQFGPTAYVEGVGVKPDIERDYMTVEDLQNYGMPFVDAFSKAMVDTITSQHTELHLRRERGR